MTGPEVTTGADLQHLPATMLQPVSFDDSLVDSLVPYESAASRRLTAERDQARRVAASLEADLARILDAWDDYTKGSEVQIPWEQLVKAIEAAREWVGRDTGAVPALDRIIDRYTLAEGMAPDNTGSAS